MRHYTNTNNPVDFPKLDRVEQLMGQALDLAVPETWTRLDADQLTKYSRKFAELLILECVQTVMDGSKLGDWYAMRIEEHFDKSDGGILHFGVEE